MRLLVFLFLFIVSQANAQPENIRHLKNQLKSVRDDSIRMQVLKQLGIAYMFVKRDSAIYYSENALALAESLGINRAILPIKVDIARSLFEDKKYIESWRLSKQIEAEAIKQNRIIVLLFAWRQMFWIYQAVGDHKQVMVYANKMVLLSKSKEFLEDTRGVPNIPIIYRLKADALLNIQQFDSAYYYYWRAYQLIDKNNKSDLLLSYINLGDYFLVRSQQDSVLYYFIRSLQLSQEIGRGDLEIRSLYNIATFFLTQTKLDSALRLAKESLRLSKQLPDSSSIESTSLLISEIYQAQNKADSAYKYLRLSVTVGKKMLLQEKVREVNEMIFNEAMQDERVIQEQKQAQLKYRNNLIFFGFGFIILVSFIITFIIFRNGKRKQQDTIRIQEAYDKLKSTQSQLIQSEKMASLGELTAGIAHEIQNPLNFVNNFSEVNNELIEELRKEIEVGDKQSFKELIDDIKANSEKINHHGKRADAIVKGMLQHSRTSSGQKELTDINALCDEYLRLSYHGYRAKDKSFNAKFESEFDPSIPKINVVPQDIGRVMLNLINNAFYAVNEKAKSKVSGYEPMVAVTTRKLNNKIEIIVKDNGNGIPEHIKEKIFQPFFTTKPTGQGTGLGLSLSYDIVKTHGGELEVTTQEGSGTKFIITLPI